MLAAHHRLSNLRVLVDRNGLQSLTSTEDTVRLELLEAKFKAFGWDCWSIDGHDHEEIASSLTDKSTTELPRLFMPTLSRGKGVPSRKTRSVGTIAPKIMRSLPAL